jgi:hypothetical protein
MDRCINCYYCTYYDDSGHYRCGNSGEWLTSEQLFTQSCRAYVDEEEHKALYKADEIENVPF